PWSMKPDTREPDMHEVERRAADRGLPPVRWPEGWPVDTYSLAPLRAVVFAERTGRDVPLTLALYRQAFAAGRDLSELDTVLLAAADCELDSKQVLEGIETQPVKDRLREATDEALGIGVTGIPTVRVGDELFWGDDRLEDAAAAVVTIGGDG